MVSVGSPSTNPLGASQSFKGQNEWTSACEDGWAHSVEKGGDSSLRLELTTSPLCTALSIRTSPLHSAF